MGRGWAQVSSCAVLRHGSKAQVAAPVTPGFALAGLRRGRGMLRLHLLAAAAALGPLVFFAVSGRCQPYHAKY